MLYQKTLVLIRGLLKNYALTSRWAGKRESVRAKIRSLIRVTLKKHKYPPDNQPEAIELVMQQTEALSNEWSSVS